MKIKRVCEKCSHLFSIKTFLPSNHYLWKLTDISFSASQTTQQRFWWFNNAKQCYEQLTTHFKFFPLFGMEKKLYYGLEYVYSGKLMYHQSPIHGHTEKFIELHHIDTLQLPWQFHRYVHTSQSHDLSWIINKSRRVSCWNCTYSSMSSPWSLWVRKKY